MHVAFVSLVTAHHRETTAGDHLQRVAEALVDRGHEVTVFCSRWWGGDLTRFERNGVTYHAVTVCPSEASFVAKLPVLVGRYRPDVLHVAQHPASQTLAARVSATVARAPVVLDWFAPTTTRFARQALGAATRIVTPSELSATAARELGASEDKLTRIPGWVDMDLIRETEPDDSADIVYCRRLDADANLDALLLALGELRGRDWQTAVIGDGPQRAAYEQQARDLRIADRVTFLGDRPLDDRVARFKGAHVFAQTARREPFARHLLWGLACGCVGVVQYESDSAAHELVEGHERGYRATSEEELSHCLRSASDDERQAIDESFAEYDRRAVLNRLLDCYERADEQRGLL
jgi:glycosyltransferase involved in cell wall biosynthesis